MINRNLGSMRIKNARLVHGRFYRIVFEVIRRVSKKSQLESKAEFPQIIRVTQHTRNLSYLVPKILSPASPRPGMM